MFIELTDDKGELFIGNVNLLQRVHRLKNGKAYVIGWNNNGGFETTESYEEVVNILHSEGESIIRKTE